MHQPIHWVLEIDLKSFFDTLDHGWLRRMVDVRMGDGVIQKLIGKDLISFDGHMFQVLSLPKQPVPARKRLLVNTEDMHRSDPATVCQLIKKNLGVSR